MGKKLEIEEVVSSIAETMAGNGWCGQSPYDTRILEDGRSIIIEDRETGEKYHVLVMPILSKIQGSDPAG